MSTDFRVIAYLEAQECFKQNREWTVKDPEFWANLLGAAANSALASVPDSVAIAAAAEIERRQAETRKLQRAIQRGIKKKLDE